MKARFGVDWKQRCVIFLAPLPTATVPVTTVALTAMSAKTKWSIAAIALLAFPIYSVLSADPDPIVSNEIEVAQVEPATQPGLDNEGMTEAGERTEALASIPEEESANAGTGGHLLTVWSSDSKTPAADVEVYYFDISDPNQDDFKRGMYVERLDMETLLARYGHSTRTDANGQVRLPQRQSYMWISARNEDKYAQKYLLEDLSSNSYAEVGLVLQPRVNIHTRVLNSAGKPMAGIAVAYQSQYADGHGNNLDRVITDDDGRAVLRNMQVRFQNANRNHAHLIAVDLPLAQALHHRFALHSPPQDEIVFQLPETTSVDVRVEHADGSPIRDGFPVVMHADFLHLSDGKTAAEGSYKLKGSQDASMAYVRNGIARFEHVGVALPVVVGTHFPGGSFTVARGISSNVPNGSSEILLQAPPQGTQYQTRLTHADGTPFAGALIEIDFHLQRPQDDGETRLIQHGMRTRSDENGQVSWLEEKGQQHGLVTWADADGGRIQWGLIHVDANQQLSDEVVMGEQLILQGEVRDAAGQPLANAQVSFELPWVPSITGNPNWPWETRFLNARTDANGQIEIRGTFSDSSAYLAWSAPDLRKYIRLSIAPDESLNTRNLQTFDFELGKANQVFQLQSKGEVAGRIAMDAGIPSDAVKVELKFQAQGQSEETFRFTDIEAGTGQFQFAALKEGTASLRIQTSLTHELILQSPSFEIESGTNSIPEDWQVIDLTGKLFPHQVEVKNTSGQLLDLVDLSYQHGNSIWTSNRKNPIYFVTPEPQALIRLSAPNHYTSPLLIVGEHHTETLKPAIALAVNLPSNITLPPNTQWQIAGRQTDANHQSNLATWAPQALARIHPGQATTTIQIPQTGEWHFALIYCGPGTGPIDPYAPKQLAKTTTGQPTYTTTITPNPTPITIPIDQASIDLIHSQS